MQELFFQWVVRFGFRSVHLVEIYIKGKNRFNSFNIANAHVCIA